MLPGANDVVHGFQPFVNGVSPFEPVLQEAQAVVLPESLVIEIADLVMHHRAVVISGRFLACGQVEGLAHARFDKALVNIHVALPAGIDAHIPGRVGVVEVEQAVCFCRRIGHYRFLGIAAIQARRQDDGKEDGYIGKVADGLNFP